MSIPRTGYAHGLIRNMAADANDSPKCSPLSLSIPFLEERGDMDDALIEFVSCLMDIHGHDTNDLTAHCLCAFFDYIWNGHAGIYHENLDEIFQRWARLYLHDSMFDVQSMKQWMQDINNIYIYGTQSPILFDKKRQIYTTPKLASLQKALSHHIHRFIDSEHDMSFDEENRRALQRIKVSNNTELNDWIAQSAAKYTHDNQIIKPDTEQVEAVSHFMKHKLTVIAGGPGTGKTSMVVCQILKLAIQAFEFAPDEVLLAAPTGKAAQRMKEAIDSAISNNGFAAQMAEKLHTLNTQTLHRMLNIRPNALSSFGLHHPLNAKLIIVDESSMISLEMANALFSAINPQRTRLVLVGDPNQLPPVDVGEILSNFVSNENKEKLGRFAVELHHNHRTDHPAIYQCQNYIIQGKWDELSKIEPKSAKSLEFENFEYVDDLNQAGALLTQWTDKMISAYPSGQLVEDLIKPYPADLSELDDLERLNRTFHHLDKKFRILSPVNEGKYGIAQLNAAIMNRLGLDTQYTFPAGCLVMLTQNNYQINHFNGETGIVILKRMAEACGTGSSVKPYVAFPNVLHGFDMEPLDLLMHMLMPAFAMTIHKSQGSEYNHGLIILPPQQSLLLSPNLLYTAISRTRNSATLLALRDIFKICVYPPMAADPGLPDI